jgi:hypothetical protein
MAKRCGCARQLKKRRIRFSKAFARRLASRTFTSTWFVWFFFIGFNICCDARFEESSHLQFRQQQQEQADYTEHVAKLSASIEFEHSKAAKALQDADEQKKVVAECDAKVFFLFRVLFEGFR